MEYFLKWRHNDRKWSKVAPCMTEWPNDHFWPYFRQKAYSGGILKTNASDIFSLGRVFLFMMLPKESFLKFLFVPITSSTDKDYLMNTILNLSDIFGLIRLMMKTQRSSRIQLSQVRINFNDLKRNSQITINSFTRNEIDRIATQNLSPEILNYIQDLDHIS